MRAWLVTLVLVAVTIRARAQELDADAGVSEQAPEVTADAAAPVDEPAPEDAGPSADDAGVPDDGLFQIDPLATGAVAVDAGVPEDALFQVAAVDVVGHVDESARTAPGAVYVLDERRLSVFKHDDALQVLAQVPGVYVRQEDGFGLRPNIGMRGADVDRSKKVTLLEDGLLFGPAPYSAPAAYYFPLMMRMTGVEVFKGASAIRYGPQTIGGALDLRTRDVPERGPVAGVDGAFGRFYYTKLHAYGGYGAEHAGFLAEGASVSSDGFKEIDRGGDTGFSKQEFMLKGRLNTDPDAHVYQRLLAKLGYAREDSNETYLGLSDADFRAKPVRRYQGSSEDGMEWWRSQGELFHTLGVGEHFQLDTALYRHDFSRVWNRVDALIDTAGNAPPSLLDVLRNPDDRYYPVLTGQLDSESAQAGILQAGNERKYVAQGVQTVAHTDFVTGVLSHALELGLRVHQDDIRRHHRAYGYAMAPVLTDSGERELAMVRDGVARPDLAHNEVDSLAVAAHLVYDLGYRNLTLSPGVRGELIRATYTEKLGSLAGQKAHANSETALFALGARYAVTEQVALLGGVQQGMTPVAPDLTNSVSAPERATNYELGARYVDAHGQASLFGFVSDYDRIVAPCDEQCSSATSTTFAGGKALIAGLELGADYTVVLPRAFTLPVRLAYTYTHAEFTEGFDTTYEIWGGGDDRVDAGDGIPYIPAHQASLGTGFAFKNVVGFDAQLGFFDRMREEASQGTPQTGRYTDRYVLLEASAYYQVLKHLRIYLKGDNLTNAQPLVSRRPFGARPNKPLLVQAGFVWTL